MALSDSTKTATMLHKWHHDDYEEAKKQIYDAIGSIEDLEIFGSYVLVAVYVRPNINPTTGFIMGGKAQNEDIYNGKAVLILASGPDAFQGDEGWLAAQYGKKAPPVRGDWCFLAEASGIPTMYCGDGAKRSRVPDRHGELFDVYSWDGWPCRIVSHTDLIGRMNAPHTIV